MPDQGGAARSQSPTPAAGRRPVPWPGRGFAYLPAASSVPQAAPFAGRGAACLRCWTRLARCPAARASGGTAVRALLRPGANADVGRAPAPHAQPSAVCNTRLTRAHVHFCSRATSMPRPPPLPILPPARRRRRAGMMRAPRPALAPIRADRRQIPAAGCTRPGKRPAAAASAPNTAAPASGGMRVKRDASEADFSWQSRRCAADRELENAGQAMPPA